MRKRFFSIIVCVVMLFTMNVTAFAAETQENYSETEKTMTFEITPTRLWRLFQVLCKLKKLT